MTWFTRVQILVTLAVVSATASAQRIYFGDAAKGIKARLDTRAVATRGDMASVEVRFSIPAIDVNRDTDGFDAVDVDGMVPLDEAGKPHLMTTGTLVAVPLGYEAEVEVVDLRQESLDGIVVQPAQRRFRCGGSDYRSGFEFDTALYQSRDLYPARLVETQEVGRLQGLRLVRVGINPFQARLGDKSLQVAHDLTLRVHFRKTKAKAGVVELPASLYQIARNISANGQYMWGAVRPAAGAETMLVFVGDSLKASLDPLVAWKRTKGLEVKVVTLTEAGGTKEAVQKYIQNYYDTASVKPSYLLFVGNKTTMPPFMESTSAGSAASDFRFSLLSGGDNVPDVLYGRIVADNEAEVKLQVDRWIAYEKSPEAGTWYPQATTISSNEGSNPSDKEYAQMAIDALKAGTYTKGDVFSQGDGNATAANISAALAEGRTWLAYWGHGSGTSWGSTNGSFGNSQVAGLTNADRLPILIDVACQNASWVHLNKCFGKAWVTHTSGGKPAGAVAFYGGSVNISWHPPAVMSVGVAKYHFEKPVHTLGGSVLAGQLYLIEKMGTGNNTLDNLKWYNLLGDPSLLVRTDVPRAYQLKYRTLKNLSGVTVDITAVDTKGNGVAGLTASVASATGMSLAVGTTDAQGRAVLTVSGVTQLGPNTLLTTTGYNAETQQVVIQ